MWRKEDSKLKSSPGGPQAGSLEQDSSNAPAAVNRGIKIKGEISGQGDFFLDGDLEGKISLGNGTLTIGPNSRVNAEIEARIVEIRGEVVGALKACERVHIWSTGKLTGPMETRGIVIEDGAVLHSKVAVPQAEAQKADSPEASVNETGESPQASSSEPLQRAKGSGA